MPSRRPLKHRQRLAHHLVQIAAHRLRRRESARTARTRPPASSPIPPTCAMVAAHSCTMRAVPGGRSRRSSCRPMRSAESAIGVSGFLISCATRRATSCQAAAFCARSSSLVSSSTITKPEVSFSSSAETVTARCSFWLSVRSSSLPRGQRRCGARASSGSGFRRCLRARRDLPDACALRGLPARKDLGQRAIDAVDRAVGADRDHAGRNALQDGLGEAAAPVQLDAAGFQLPRSSG